MPRKKRTRAGRTKLSRPAKVVEEQMEDLSDLSMCSAVSEALPTKEERIAICLQNFDNYVEKTVKEMRAAMTKTITDQRNFLKMELLKLPKDIRQMKFSDFLASGGNLDALMLNEAATIADSAISMESLRRAIANGVNETPAHCIGMNPSLVSTLGYKTPFITPKFDPRLPITTTRRPKHGETLVSLAGSPVMSLPGNKGKIDLAMGAGKSPSGIASMVLDMSPNSLVDKEEQLIKLRGILDSKIQQIGKAVGTA
eukprot:gene7419-8239_t